jgi:hypothetical protein
MVLKEFIDSDVPPYAILSHCRGSAEDEVSFRQFQAGENQMSSGFRKIKQCCRLAKSHGLEWAWVDTCCIEKTSSAELSESINSMYTWYRDALAYYTFLEDLEVNVHFIRLPVAAFISPINDKDSSFDGSYAPHRRGSASENLLKPSSLMSR